MSVNIVAPFRLGRLGRQLRNDLLEESRLCSQFSKAVPTIKLVQRYLIYGSAIAALEAHRKAQAAFREQFGSDYRTDLDLVFANPDGTPLRPDSISASISALFKRLKLPKPKGASLHLLRHSHGSHLLAAGMELPAVSERLGHSSVYVTATVYSHMPPGRDKEAARKWDEFQKKNTKDSQTSKVV